MAGPAAPDSTTLQRPFSFWHPAKLLATWFGAGLLPWTPGTWGSLAALPFAWVIDSRTGTFGLLAAAAMVFLVGLWATHVYEQRTGLKDPGAVVIDEVAAQWLTLAVVWPDPLLYGVGFVAFRLADIAKPWPANWIDRRVPGAIGSMLDDLVAAGYAAAALWLLSIAIE